MKLWKRVEYRIIKLICYWLLIAGTYNLLFSGDLPEGYGRTTMGAGLFWIVFSILVLRAVFRRENEELSTNIR